MMLEDAQTHCSDPHFLSSVILQEILCYHVSMYFVKGYANRLGVLGTVLAILTV